MKAITCATLFFGLLSGVLAQDPGPSPTESVGCEPHGDHWHCEAPRETTAPDAAVTTTAADAVVTTTTVAAGEDDHDHDHDHEGESDEHTDAAGTGTLAPSPTESFGCEPHGDHWHCEGHISETAAGAGTAQTTLATTTTPPAGAGAVTTTSTPTGAAAHQATGMALAGLVAVAAMAL